MRHLTLSAIMLMTLATQAIAQPKPPTTARSTSAPTSAPATETIGPNLITFIPPADWKPLGKRTDERSVGYMFGDDLAQIVVTVTPQPQIIPDELAPKLANQLKQTIKKQEDDAFITIITPAKVETDKRFLLKMHDRFRAISKFGDRMQYYQGVGRNMVSVVATSFSEDPTEAAKIHVIGEKVILSVKLIRPPTSRPAAR